MKVYAVIVDSLGTRKAFAVRAAGSAAVVQLLDAGNVRYFQQLTVDRLEELTAIERNPDILSESGTVEKCGTYTGSPMPGRCSACQRGA